MEPRLYTGPSDLAEGLYNLLEPVGPAFADLRRIEVVVVPGMSFDDEGHRLGRGRGYYDRFLEQVPEAYTIGVCYHFQRVAHVPTDPYDRAVDEVVSNRA